MKIFRKAAYVVSYHSRYKFVHLYYSKIILLLLNDRLVIKPELIV